MGNAFSSKVKLQISDGELERVKFDLRKKAVKVKYSGGGITVRTQLPIQLGEKAVEVSDAVALARDASLEVITFPINLEERRRFDSSEITRDPDLLKELRSDVGIPVGLERSQGHWVKAGSLDSDSGVLYVYGRVSTDIEARVRVELDRRNWIGFKRSFVIVQAKGLLHLSVMVRFEARADYHPLAIIWSHLSSLFPALCQPVQRRQHLTCHEGELLRESGDQDSRGAAGPDGTQIIRYNTEISKEPKKGEQGKGHWNMQSPQETEGEYKTRGLGKQKVAE